MANFSGFSSASGGSGKSSTSAGGRKQTAQAYTGGSDPIFGGNWGGDAPF